MGNCAVAPEPLEASSVDVQQLASSIRSAEATPILRMPSQRWFRNGTNNDADNVRTTNDVFGPMMISAASTRTDSISLPSFPMHNTDPTLMARGLSGRAINPLAPRGDLRRVDSNSGKMINPRKSSSSGSAEARPSKDTEAPLGEFGVLEHSHLGGEMAGSFNHDESVNRRRFGSANTLQQAPNNAHCDDNDEGSHVNAIDVPWSPSSAAIPTQRAASPGSPVPESESTGTGTHSGTISGSTSASGSAPSHTIIPLSVMSNLQAVVASPLLATTTRPSLPARPPLPPRMSNTAVACPPLHLQRPRVLEPASHTVVAEVAKVAAATVPVGVSDTVEPVGAVASHMSTPPGPARTTAPNERVDAPLPTPPHNIARPLGVQRPTPPMAASKRMVQLHNARLFQYQQLAAALLPQAPPQTGPTPFEAANDFLLFAGNHSLQSQESMWEHAVHSSIAGQTWTISQHGW